MDEDPKTAKLLPDMQRHTTDFINRTFIDPCGEGNVVWFRNWQSLKSVDSVDHLHVMIFNPDMTFLDRLTGGDWPLALKLGYLML